MLFMIANATGGYGRKAAFFALGLVLGVAVPACGWAFGWFAPLSLEAVMALGVLCCCIVWWVASVFPEAVTALIMVVLFIAVCGVPTETALSAFASSTWWLLVAAFALGFGMQRCGLMRRMANAILRRFPRTFSMQAAGLMAAGTLIGPFIPSLSAKATMLAPLTLGISDSMGYARKSRPAEGLFLAMFTGLRNVGPAVISASIIGYGLVATLPAEVAARFDMLHWFLGMLPWFIFVMAGCYLTIVALYAPRKTANTASAADATDGADSATATAAPSAEAVGEGEGRTPMTVAEKRMAVIMVCCIGLWVTEPLHGIGSHLVALGAMVAMLIGQVVPLKELRAGIAWESLIFIGCVLGLASVFASLGIDRWIVGACAPAFEALAQSPYLFILGICVATILLRFIIVSEMAYINIFMAFMVPLSVSLGISPWVVGVSIYAVVNPWFVLYQNPIYLTAYYATEGKMVRQSVMARYCGLYLGICIAGLMISIPYWQFLGLI